MRLRHLWLSVLAAVVLGAAACGGDGESASTTPTTEGEKTLSVFGAYATAQPDIIFGDAFGN